MNTVTYHQTPIYVGESFENFEQYLKGAYTQTILLIDENVYLTRKKEFDLYEKIIIPSGEEQKSMQVVEKIIGELLRKGADRESFLVGVGGGVVCDITGFVASIFMRGIRFGFVPTTLLAQVDASIGGKNGVNTGMYKNMIGTFTQPEFILIDSSFLKTLPKQELVSGMAEVVKHACIRDEEYFHYIEKNTEAILALDAEILHQIILHSVRIKSEIVEQDEKEGGLRKLLNFGHTFGHAIEKQHNLPHGYAISLGMCVVNALAVDWGVLDQSSDFKIRTVLKKIGLPVETTTLNLRSLCSIIYNDKKRSGDQIDLILIEGIGRSLIKSKSFESLTNNKIFNA